jgi:hypothetical protein
MYNYLANNRGARKALSYITVEKMIDSGYDFNTDNIPKGCKAFSKNIDYHVCTTASDVSSRYGNSDDGEGYDDV